MSCLNYRSMDHRMDRTYHLNTSRSYNHYNSNINSPNIHNPCTENYTKGSYTTDGWITPMSVDYSRSTTGTDTSGEARFNSTTINCRGDQPVFPPESTVETRKIVNESARDRRISISNVTSLESIKTRLNLLEEKNVTMREKCCELLTEKENFKTCLDREKSRNKELEYRVTSLQAALMKKETELSEKSNKQLEDKTVNKMENSSSTTDIVATVEKGVQNWSLCKGCQRKLESCINGAPAVAITRSELDILEKDMQVLRDAVIAREEAWDKAMEQEQTYRQQILKLTCETITMRHILESREQELKTIADVLKKKECDFKNLQKKESSLIKIVTKLNKYQRENLGNTSSLELTEKEQRMIEECSRQVLSSLKGKHKMKPRGYTVSEKNNSTESQRTSPRNNTNNNNNTSLGKD